MTEEEQLETIKKWWRRYGNWVTIGVSFVLLCGAGYRYFEWHQQKMAQQASMTYERMMQAVSDQHIPSVRSYANELITHHHNTVYEDAAHLALAKVYVAKNKLALAKKELHAIIADSHLPALKQIAKIRTARILSSEHAYADALAQLSSLDDTTYASVINELKGDIYSATGEYKDAITAYRLAQDEMKINGMSNLFLEMKTNELLAKTQASDVVAPSKIG